MALIVEDGTGVENANSYSSLADANSYHALRGNTEWSDASEPVREQALVKATDHVEKRFGSRFIGQKETKAQPLSWPRENAVDRDGFSYDEEVPEAVKKATAEYALKLVEGATLIPDPEQQGVIQSESVGPISVSYDTSQISWSAVPPMPHADLLLKPIIRRGGRVVRA